MIPGRRRSTSVAAASSRSGFSAAVVLPSRQSSPRTTLCRTSTAPTPSICLVSTISHPEADSSPARKALGSAANEGATNHMAAHVAHHSAIAASQYQVITQSGMPASSNASQFVPVQELATEVSPLTSVEEEKVPESVRSSVYTASRPSSL